MHEAGILTVGSIVVGWDRHNRELARAELGEFVMLNPTFYQVMPLQAVPGTRLWKKMKEENRLVENLCYDQIRIDRATFHYMNLSQQDVVDLIDSTYDDLVDEGGPWPFRIFETYLKGMENFINHSESEFKIRARAYSKIIVRIFPLAFVSVLLFHGAGFRRRWCQAMNSYYKRSRLRFLTGAVIGVVALPLFVFQYFWGSLRHYLSKNGDQPETIYIEYHGTRI
jgi:hypothetical protein